MSAVSKKIELQINPSTENNGRFIKTPNVVGQLSLRRDKPGGSMFPTQLGRFPIRVAQFILCWSCFPFCLSAQIEPQLVHEFNSPITDIVYYAPSARFFVTTPSQLSELDARGGSLQSVTLPIDQVTQILISPVEPQLLIAGGVPGQSGCLIQLDPTTLQITKSIAVLDDVVMGVAWNSRSQQTWGVGITGELFAIDWPTGKTRMVGHHAKAITSIAALRDASFVTTSEDMSIRVWDSHDVRLTRALNQHTDSVLGVVVLSDSVNDAGLPEMIATWSTDRTVRFWQPANGRLVRFVTLEQIPNCGCWLPGSQSLIVGDRTGSLHWIDWKTAQVQQSRVVADDWISAIESDSNNEFLWVGTMRGRLYRVPNPK